MKRQVKVKLLDQGAAPTSVMQSDPQPQAQPQAQPQTQLEPQSRHILPPATEDQHTATTAAAVTAAAIAATAPIMKVR